MTDEERDLRTQQEELRRRTQDMQRRVAATALELADVEDETAQAFEDRTRTAPSRAADLSELAEKARRSAAALRDRRGDRNQPPDN